MKNEAKAIAITQTQSQVNSDMMGIAGVITLSLILLFSAGFAQANVIHDTAHDTRHAIALAFH
ncbi:MAG: CbtB domain-containing protein [Litoreibacter sp.]